MRLLNVNVQHLELTEFFGDNIPPYAILSHTWGDDEVTFQDLHRGQYEHKLGFGKIQYTRQQAKRDGLQWCWVDTCCIDKSSSAELSEAINSMFSWYARARVCYAYLADVCGQAFLDQRGGAQPHVEEIFETYEIVCLASRVEAQPRVEQRRWFDAELHNETTTVLSLLELSDQGSSTPDATTGVAFCDSRWFRRGWTLQELIAPRRLKFFSRSWEPLGERDEEQLYAVVECTGLSPVVFGNPRALRETPVAQRMSWMAHRQTTRKEDEAYCLLGIFGVHMPLLYGEADMAFHRLQEELVKRFRDHSLLIFSDLTRNTSMLREPLAASPRDFAGCNHVEACNTYKIPFSLESYHLTNDAIRISLPLIRMERTRWMRDLALLGYTNSGAPLALVLTRADVNGDENTWFACDYESRHFSHINRDEDTWVAWDHESRQFSTQEVAAMPSLGSGIATIPEELAITARREMLLIARDVRYRKAYVFRRDQASDDAWVRYDLALRYNSGTPDFVVEHTVARQREARMPHMIRVKRLLSFPSKQFVLRFLLESSQHIAIVVALTRTMPNDHIRGALLITERSCVETEKQLSTMGAQLLDETFVEAYNNDLVGKKRLAFVPLEGTGVLELWHDGFIGDYYLGHSRVTLRIIHDGPDKGLLSDGTRE